MVITGWSKSYFWCAKRIIWNTSAAVCRRCISWVRHLITRLQFCVTTYFAKAWFAVSADAMLAIGEAVTTGVLAAAKQAIVIHTGVASVAAANRALAVHTA